MPNLPSGTVTFLFTDIAGSTELLKELGERYTTVLADHRELLRTTFDDHGGEEIDTQGDSFFYAFPRARSAVAAAVAAQRRLFDHPWPGDTRLRVRMGLHTGEAAVGDEGYVGLDVVRAARISAIAGGDQVLLSETTTVLVGSDLPEDVSVHPLGRRRLKGIDRPEPIFALAVAGLPQPEVVAGDSPDTKLSAEAADAARQQIERRVLADMKRAVEDAEKGRTRGWSETVRWVLVVIVVTLGTIILLSALAAILTQQ